ncbi:hypothetical protein GLOIN_2v1782616 [Rhizophagus irregularis DAOM 181602=DAOM 197198]|uniref:C2 domain-containing protein n=1 Tax=Rhizophagus irregularis (strain DAOM 181602 / DAOM 197198 / MUCL 43194) TaxID=747089 RepID=A0A2P4PH15_RHIID|nr:hypothetical protein GLOIN_2v1782616 [Rhizophagus irregularis DAOM 181602=DAOM 197198]POG64676.1 hypothetical protein GLOIN_2v1782616 [Rhizophagus irregularis DAOM 181602=DAOM 197198]|eukprot:XP_025171542.1 hypothetical protein GLOIN_2v1782616 [Rhizophagus irregularis DAOM 181602=DAOM 197198]
MKQTSSKTRTQHMVELRIALENIPKLDKFSQSDPQVLLFLKDRYNNWESKPHGMTERIKNEANTKFSTSFCLEYRFEELQEIMFLVLDIDNHQSLDIKCQQEVGKGTITIVGREILTEKNRKITLRVQARNLALKNWIVKPDVFFELSRKDGGNKVIEDILVYKSERRNTKNVSWDSFVLLERDFWQNDGKNPDDYIRFACFHHKQNGKHKLLGESTLRVIDFLENEGRKQRFPLGGLSELLVSCEFEKTFLEYIDGGLEVQLNIAIDFTASNRDKNYDLHKNGPDETCYEYAIRVVGNILERYDSDKQISVYGFGGEFNNSGFVSHEFALTVSERLEKSVSQNQNVYGVLLIITDGQVTSMTNTIKAIMEAKREPRDIVHFVEMKKFVESGMNKDLPKAVLEEIPDQILEYMTKKYIKPRKAEKSNTFYEAFNDQSPPPYSER